MSFAATPFRQSSAPTPRIRTMLDAPLAYEPVWRDMQAFTDAAGADTPDEFWFLAHEPVFTQGTNGRPEHVLAPGDIPIAPSDRGGQVTYHGPGQLMGYVLADVRRLGMGIRSLVEGLELAVIETLDGYGIMARARRDAPGVYVPAAGDAKIASLGLRVRRGRCYHGLALNVDLDLEPFTRINPCGYQGLAMARIVDLAGPIAMDQVAADLAPAICRRLGLPRPPLPEPRLAPAPAMG